MAVEAKNVARLKSLKFKGPQVRRRPQPRIRDSHAIEGPHVRRLGTSVDIVNTARHAQYKHEGTLGVIFPQGRLVNVRKGESYMQIPEGPWGPRRVKSVRGQIGDPWVRTAVEEVILRRYGV